jgi:hypothetical protein
MGFIRVWIALFAVAFPLVAPPSASAQAAETPATVAARMRMHVENAGMRWTDEPLIAADQFSAHAAGTLGQAQALLVDLAGSEPNIAVSKVEMVRAPDSLLHRGSPLLVTVTARMVAGSDDATSRLQWVMPALFTLFLRGVVQSQETIIMNGVVGDGAFRIEGRIHGPNGPAPLVKGLDAAPSKLVTSAEVKQSKVVQTVPDDGGGMPRKKDVIVSFVVSGSYLAQNATVDSLKALSYQ